MPPVMVPLQLLGEAEGEQEEEEEAKEPDEEEMSRPLLKRDSDGAAPTGRGQNWRRGMISGGANCSVSTKDLKKLAKDNNASTYGKKGEIVERLLALGVTVLGAMEMN